MLAMMQMWLEMQVHNYQSLSFVPLPGMELFAADTQDHAVES